MGSAGVGKFGLVRLAAMACLFAGAAGVAWFASMRVGGEPRQRFDAVERMNQLLLSQLPLGENAWRLYEALARWAYGGDAMSLPDFESALTDEMAIAMRDLNSSAHPRYGDWDDPIWNDRRRKLEALRPVLRLLDRAADAPTFSIHSDAATLDDLLIENVGQLGAMRRFANLNTSAMRAAAETGDWDELVRRFRTGVAMAHQTSYRPLLIDQLVSISIMAMVHRELHMLLMEIAIPADICDRLLDTLDELRWPALDPGDLIEGERIYRAEWIQRAFSDDGRGGGHLLIWSSAPWTPGDTPFDEISAPPLRRLLALSPDALVAPSRRSIERATSREFDIIRQLLRSEVSDQAVLNELREAERTIEGAVEEEYSISMLPSTELIRTTFTIQTATEVMLRLARRRAETGAWPRTLEEAMRREETIDPVSGAPFRYNAPPLDDEAGRPFILMAPDSYPFTVGHSGWPELNQPRPPIEDYHREEEAQRQREQEERWPDGER